MRSYWFAALRRTATRLLFAAAVASMVCFIASDLFAQTYPAGADTPPPWPLPVLSKNVRFKKLTDLAAGRSYKLILATGTMNEDSCAAVLDLLKHSSRQDILEPVHVAQSMEDPWVQHIMKSCEPRLNVDRVYEATTTSNASDLYFQATTNMEFYDLSGKLGRGVWGYFGEGVVPHCNPDPASSLGEFRAFCTSLHGYAIYQGAIGTVFSTSSCESMIGGVLRGGKRLRNNVSKPDEYQERPGFFAFVQLKDALYQVVFQTNAPIEANRHPDSLPTRLYLTEIRHFSPTGTVSTCVFGPQHE